MKQRERGFTLIEIMVVLLISTFFMMSVYKIFNAGAKSSLNGMLRIDTTLEGRRIIKQVYNDLKNASFVLDGTQRELPFSELVKKDGDSYTFLSLPLHGTAEDAIPTGGSGKAYRRASRITYVLEASDSAANPFKKLIRKETFHPEHPLSKTVLGGVETHMLSTRVNSFEIRPYVQFSKGKTVCCYWITLQLRDAPLKGQLKSIGKSSTPTVSTDILIADFFDVVVPEFHYRLLVNDNFNLNWHTGVVGP